MPLPVDQRNTCETRYRAKAREAGTPVNEILLSNNLDYLTSHWDENNFDTYLIQDRLNDGADLVDLSTKTNELTNLNNAANITQLITTANVLFGSAYAESSAYAPNQLPPETRKAAAKKFLSTKINAEFSDNTPTKNTLLGPTVLNKLINYLTLNSDNFTEAKLTSILDAIKNLKNRDTATFETAKAELRNAGVTAADIDSLKSLTLGQARLNELRASPAAVQVADANVATTQTALAALDTATFNGHLATLNNITNPADATTYDQFNTAMGAVTGLAGAELATQTHYWLSTTHGRIGDANAWVNRSFPEPDYQELRTLLLADKKTLALARSTQLTNPRHLLHPENPEFQTAMIHLSNSITDDTKKKIFRYGAVTALQKALDKRTPYSEDIKSILNLSDPATLQSVKDGLDKTDIANFNQLQGHLDALTNPDTDLGGLKLALNYLGIVPPSDDHKASQIINMRKNRQEKAVDDFIAEQNRIEDPVRNKLAAKIKSHCGTHHDDKAIIGKNLLDMTPKQRHGLDSTTSKTDKAFLGRLAGVKLFLETLTKGCGDNDSKKSIINLHHDIAVNNRSIKSRLKKTVGSILFNQSDAKKLLERAEAIKDLPLPTLLTEENLSKRMKAYDITINRLKIGLENHLYSKSEETRVNNLINRLEAKQIELNKTLTEMSLNSNAVVSTEKVQYKTVSISGNTDPSAILSAMSNAMTDAKNALSSPGMISTAVNPTGMLAMNSASSRKDQIISTGANDIVAYAKDCSNGRKALVAIIPQHQETPAAGGAPVSVAPSIYMKFEGFRGERRPHINLLQKPKMPTYALLLQVKNTLELELTKLHILKKDGQPDHTTTFTIPTMTSTDTTPEGKQEVKDHYMAAALFLESRGIPYKFADPGLNTEYKLANSGFKAALKKYREIEPTLTEKAASTVEEKQNLKAAKDIDRTLTRLGPKQ